MLLAYQASLISSDAVFEGQNAVDNFVGLAVVTPSILRADLTL